jgi:glycosyltransferase involved in cell wall biosynthesis
MFVSVLVPVYNEAESLPILLEQITAALEPLGAPYEVICVDDGSSDESVKVLRELTQRYSSLRAVELRRNFGQTAAMQAGLDLSRGQYVAFLDADLQNDPADIPQMLEHLRAHDLDMVAGWRADRQDTLLSRRLPSVVANRLISATTKVRLHDYGCSLKLMTADTAKQLRLYGEMHRFIPAIANWKGARIQEMAVNHRARQFGVSKYGISRTVRVILDLLVVLFVQKFSAKPMQVFGLGGILSACFGTGICGWLAVDKLVNGASLANRPLLLLGALLIVVGIQLLSTGLVADLLARTYYESQDKRAYVIRREYRAEVDQASQP